MVAFFTALGLGLGACASGENIRSVNADEFETAIMADTVQLVDVRTPEEYAEGHIAYAVNIDVQSPQFKSEAKAKLDTSKLTYVYCRSGKRSMMAAQTLVKAGYKVVNLKGGIMEWEEAGKPVSK